MKAFKLLDRSELIAAGLLIVLGILVVWGSLQWPYMTKDGPGPAFFPIWIGIALIGLSVALITMQLGTAAHGRAAEKTNWAGARQGLLGWAALVVATALLEPAGFVASFILLSVFLIRFNFQRSWREAMVVSLVSTAAFWILFVKLLEVRLPAGPWGF